VARLHGIAPDEESLMRILVLAISMIVTLAAIAAAQAQTYSPDYPVCLQTYAPRGGGYIECAYTSLAQCNQSASGRGAECYINPYFSGAQLLPKPHGRRHRRVY
jgi:hypothetical protein